MERIPPFTVKEPVFKSSCDFYLFHPEASVIALHKEFSEAHDCDGQVVRPNESLNHYILWVSQSASIGTIEHECIHLAANILDFMGGFPGDSEEMEPLIRVFDYYRGEAHRRV